MISFLLAPGIVTPQAPEAYANCAVYISASKTLFVQIGSGGEGGEWWGGRGRGRPHHITFYFLPQSFMVRGSQRAKHALSLRTAMTDDTVVKHFLIQVNQQSESLC